jgi:pimeloyl-ACP methyl ester carboxylesterase
MGGTVGIMVAILRPDLVSRLTVAEGNISPGGGALSSHVASHSEDQWVQEGHAAFLQNMRTAAREGDPFSAFFSGALGTTDPIGFYRSAVALVELEPTFKEKFLRLSLPRTFVYGEKSLLDNAGSAQADVPDRKDFDQHGINVAIVPNAGHGMNFDNLRGFVDVLKAALTTSDTDKAQ